MMKCHESRLDFSLTPSRVYCLEQSRKAANVGSRHGCPTSHWNIQSYRLNQDREVGLDQRDENDAITGAGVTPSLVPFKTIVADALLPTDALVHACEGHCIWKDCPQHFKAVQCFLGVTFLCISCNQCHSMRQHPVKAACRALGCA